MGTTKKLRNLDSSYHPIKIHIDYNSLNSRNLVNSSYIDNIKSVITETTNHLAMLLQVKNDYQVQINNPSKCDYTIITTQPLNVDADIVIFPVILSQSQLGESVIAAASACFIDARTRRPIAGILFLGSSYDFSRANSNQYLEMVLLHEITHILAFSSVLFEFFPNQPVYANQTINGVNRKLLTTPEVVKRAQNHFGCDNITGVELENQGGLGSVGSHWEARLMLGDYMISTDYDETVISDITLALFEDSGWYKVNYYSGGLFRYGKNQGCTFLEEKCIKNGVPTFEEFCNTPNKGKCLPGNISKGKCYIVNYSNPIPAEYRYFSSDIAGGFMPADYCPVALPQEDIKYYIPSSCKYGKKDQYLSAPEEVIGDSSICIESSLTIKDYLNVPLYNNNFKAMCHQVSCNKENQEIIITIGTTTVSCPRGTSTITVPGYDGKIKCPDYSRICGGSEWCNDPIECINKKSLTVKIEEKTVAQEPSPSQLESSSSEKASSEKESSTPPLSEPSDLTAEPSDSVPELAPVSSESSISSSYSLHFCLYIYLLCMLVFI